MTDTSHDPSIPPTRPARRGFGAGALALVLAVGLAAGGGGAWWLGHRHAHDEGAGAATAEAKPRYVCPMHPSVVSDHPGDCPICGMKLVLAAPQGPAARAGGAAAGAEAAPAKYVCPMHPNITSDRPGECPICGMKLVAVKAGDESDPHAAHRGGPAAAEGLATVQIDPQRQQLIGLRTARAAQGSVGGSWRTNGRVAVDETRVHHVNIKVGGFAERVYVDYVGKYVKAGEPLFSIYSPELLSVQEEYLLALRTRDALGKGGATGSAGDDLVAAARRRLELWDIPESAIEALEKTGKPRKDLTLYAPMSGVVTKKEVVMGHRIEDGAMPYEITDLSQVWVLADAYETDLARLKLGMSATLSLQAFPNKQFKGKVIFVDPLLDAKTRTAKVRLAFPNPTGELRPEMFGEVTLRTPARDGLRIPADAVIDSGTRKVVFVALGDGKFQPREVRLGAGDVDFVEVLGGLAAGDEVVTRANFLIDSESRLRASLASMGGGKP
jgi:Cu(I)/Ag(I) efflux system membrane fusion protein